MTEQVLYNLASLLDEHARSRPTHPALVHGAETYPYAAFALSVRRFAEALARDGVRKGDLVGIGLKDRPAHLMALFAVMRLGAVIVPVDYRWSAAETQSLAQHFRLEFLITEPESPDIAGPVRITIDAAWSQTTATLPGAIDAVDEPDLPMILSLSSGTTGRPTGPLLTHAQMMARTENQIVTLTFNQHDRYLLATPLYFGGGRAFALTHLMIGATLILFPPPYAPEDLVTAVASHRATSTFLVPTLIRRLLELPDAALAGLGELRLLISSGAPLHTPERAEIESRICPGFIEYFASTEGGGVSIMVPSERPARPDSVGRAAFRVQLEVVDDAHNPVPPGEPGMVRYCGPGVALGFFRDPEKSAEVFRDGWFYPGDIGRIDAEGYLTLLGRSKSVIIRGGANIYPLEIERVLEAHPAVAEAAVFGIEDRQMGEEIAAAVVLRSASTADDLRAYCRDRLAPYKMPRRIDFFDSLPRNTAGKVLLRDLKAAIDSADAE